MCIALPMRVTALNGRLARCERPGKSLWADTALAGSVAVGDYVLVFREAILRRTDETEARQIEAALTCGIVTRPENRASYPDLGRAGFNGFFHVGAHPHRQNVKSVGFRVPIVERAHGS